MGVVETETKKRWLMAGISVSNMLKPINTKPPPLPQSIKPAAAAAPQEQQDSELLPPTTPKENRIPETLLCPPAPRKRKPSAGCQFNNRAAIEFFIPPDLETVFVRHPQAERAK